MRVWCGNDGEVATERGFDVLVEVVSVVVGEEDGIDVREVVQVEGRVCLARAGYAGAEVDMVSCVEKVGLGGGGQEMADDVGGGTRGSTSVIMRIPCHSLGLVLAAVVTILQNDHTRS